MRTPSCLVVTAARRSLVILVVIVLAMLWTATSTQAQTTLVDTSISTAGADCSTATNCASFDISNAPSFAMYLNVATSGTFNFEASVDAQSLTGGTWFSVSDEVNAATTQTSDGVRWFTNPGWRRFRVRASAINGTATLVAFRGYAGRTSATLSGALAAGNNNIGDVDVASIAAGDNNIGNVDLASAVPAGTNLIGRVQLDAQAANGGEGVRYTSAGSTEDEHAVCTGACVLFSVTATNTNAAARYLRCANATAGNTTPGTTTPILDLAIPATTTGNGFHLSFPHGLTLSTALTCWAVTGAADTDVAEVAANEIKLLYTKKS